MRINNFFLFIIFFFSSVYLLGSNDALRGIVKENNDILEELKKREGRWNKIKRQLENKGIEVEEIEKLQQQESRLESIFTKEKDDNKNPFRHPIEEIEYKNTLINTLIEKEFFKLIKDAGFVVNENQIVDYIKFGPKKLNVSFKKSIQLEKLIPLIPSIQLETKDYNKLWSYYSFSSYFFRLIATTKKLRNKVYVFIQDVGKLNDDNRLDKLKALVLIFSKAQIIQYKSLAGKESKGVKLPGYKNLLVQRYASDFVSSSSPALTAARTLYKIKPTLFEGSEVYLKGIEDFIKSNFDSTDKNSAYFYDEFIRAVKENKAQYLWRNYSGYVFGGGSIIGLLLILAKKYQLNSKFQEFLEKYRSK